MAVLEELFASLARRLRPEDVAELVRQALRNDLQPSEAKILERAARGALTRRAWGFSSMSTEFARPVGLVSQIRTARELFPAQAAPDDNECDNPQVVTA